MQQQPNIIHFSIVVIKSLSCDFIPLFLGSLIVLLAASCLFQYNLFMHKTITIGLDLSLIICGTLILSILYDETQIKAILLMASLDIITICSTIQSIFPSVCKAYYSLFFLGMAIFSMVFMTIMISNLFEKRQSNYSYLIDMLIILSTGFLIYWSIYSMVIIPPQSITPPLSLSQNIIAFSLIVFITLILLSRHIKNSFGKTYDFLLGFDNMDRIYQDSDCFSGVSPGDRFIKDFFQNNYPADNPNNGLVGNRGLEQGQQPAARV